MLTQLCQYLRNWFERDKFYGSFTIADGVLTYGDGAALPLLTGQYYRIVGSVFSDGVHRWADGEETLPDESFTGAVWSMGPPAGLLTLAAEIETWINDNQAALNSPYQSESFGGYSYSLKSGGSADGGAGGVTWQSQFAARLSPWRKM